VTPTDLTPAERLVASELHTLADIPVTQHDVESAHDQLFDRLRALPSEGESSASHRARTLLLVAAAAVALIAAALWVSNQQPPGPAGKVIARHPFLSAKSVSDYLLIPTPGKSPQRLSPCVDPRAWNARSSRVATYHEPARPDEYLNEYVLEYATRTAAHRALIDAWHRIVHCPEPTDNLDRGHFIRPGPAAGRGYDEGFDHLRSRPDTPGARTHYAWYDLTVARAGTVLVVLESTGINPPPGLLTQAVDKALPQPRWAP
jgi:hypothetical protein